MKLKIKTDSISWQEPYRSKPTTNRVGEKPIKSLVSTIMIAAIVGILLAAVLSLLTGNKVSTQGFLLMATVFSGVGLLLFITSALFGRRISMTRDTISLLQPGSKHPKYIMYKDIESFNVETLSQNDLDYVVLKIQLIAGKVEVLELPDDVDINVIKDFLIANNVRVN